MYVSCDSQSSRFLGSRRGGAVGEGVDSLVSLRAGKLALATFRRHSLADGAATRAETGFESLSFRANVKQGLESERNNSVLQKCRRFNLTIAVYWDVILCILHFGGK